MTYKLTKSNIIIRKSDNAYIPQDEGNRDYQQYLQWVAEGNEPEPVDAETAAQVWEKIKSERDRRKAAGVKVGEHWFHSDDPSRIQQIGLVMFGANIPPGLQWKTMSGAFVPMTQTLANQIFQASALNDQAIFARAEQHRIAMEASSDPASYDFSTGWPAVFGE